MIGPVGLATGRTLTGTSGKVKDPGTLGLRVPPPGARALGREPRTKRRKKRSPSVPGSRTVELAQEQVRIALRPRAKCPSLGQRRVSHFGSRAWARARALPPRLFRTLPPHPQKGRGQKIRPPSGLEERGGTRRKRKIRKAESMWADPGGSRGLTAGTWSRPGSWATQQGCFPARTATAGPKS